MIVVLSFAISKDMSLDVMFLGESYGFSRPREHCLQ